MFTPLSIIGLIVFGCFCYYITIASITAFRKFGIPDNGRAYSPIEFLFRANLEFIFHFYYFIKRKFETQKEWADELPFKTTFKYKLGKMKFENWSSSRNGKWQQEILITGPRTGMIYRGEFNMGTRKDGYFHYNLFVLERWGSDYSDTNIPIGTNLLDMDKEMKEVVNEIGRKARLESKINQSFLDTWNEMLKDIDNFEVMRTANAKK